MKICSKCLEEKPDGDFYERSSTCKPCYRERVRERYVFLMENDPIWREKELERQRKKEAKRRANGLASPQNSASKSAWAKRNLHKRRAQNLIAKAILKGKVVRKNCEVCGSEASEAHHDDYSKPFDVKWLCPKHHSERHIFLRQERERREP